HFCFGTALREPIFTAGIHGRHYFPADCARRHRSIAPRRACPDYIHRRRFKLRHRAMAWGNATVIHLRAGA
ncbi:MAG TPA: hypothetical protein VFT05_17255, partial [Burkholderiaceae bacterium]|nr:hypothetical protein [Burkholderiaceae bacterium]